MTKNAALMKGNYGLKLETEMKHEVQYLHSLLVFTKQADSALKNEQNKITYYIQLKPVWTPSNVTKVKENKSLLILCH